MHGPSYRVRANTRRHTYLVVQISLSGCGEVIGLDGRRRDVPPGTALVLVTGTEVEYGFPRSAKEPWEVMYIDIAGTAAIDAGNELVECHGHCIELGLTHPIIKTLLSRVPDGDVHHARWRASESARLSWDVIHALINSCERDDRDLTLIDKAMHLLSQDFAMPMDVGTVAKTLGVSREYLSRRFSRELGCSPAAWQREQRLHHATLLLKSGTSVGEVATSCGFATTSHFTHTFKAHYGETPSRYQSAE